MNFVPVVSNLKAAYEFSTGKTIFDGVKLASIDRNLAAASVFWAPLQNQRLKRLK
ncbi:pre-toxin TG domain-containing protein [Vibrio neptunius]|uniref:pre-toxin TG domain-containing protein n=1 Tax=Vibrio neptunius TaxID=170651 RepID=UPI003CE5333E